MELALTGTMNQATRDGPRDHSNKETLETITLYLLSENQSVPQTG